MLLLQMTTRRWMIAVAVVAGGLGFVRAFPATSVAFAIPALPIVVFLLLEVLDRDRRNAKDDSHVTPTQETDARLPWLPELPDLPRPE